MTRPARPCLVLVLLSGATALLSYVTWQRLLALDLGLTAAAASTTTATFLGGLALGTALAGRLASNWTPRRALLGYASVELIAGLAALGIAPILAAARPLLIAAYQDGQGGLSFAGLRLLLCLALVTLPAALIGAAIPLAARGLEGRTASAGRIAGMLLTTLMLGGALGALVTTLALLPALGLRQTILIGTGLKTLTALGALVLRQFSPDAERTDEYDDDRRHAAGSPTRHIPRSRRRPRRHDEETGIGKLARWWRRTLGRSPANSANPAYNHAARPYPGSAAIALATAGFVAVAQHVALTRALALTIGPTAYTFSLILVVSLLGVAGGAAIATWRIPFTRRPVTALAIAQIAMVLGAYGACLLIPRLPAIVASLVASPRPFDQIAAIETLLIASILLPATIALGAALPFGVATAAPMDRDPVRPTTRIVVAVTLGAIGGALASRFALIGQIGLQRTVIAAGLIGILSGVELVWRTRRRGAARVWVPAAGLIAAALGVAQPPWNPAPFAAGAYRADPPIAADPRYHLDAGALLYYDDGARGTVAVRSLAGAISLAIDGSIVASNAGDLLRQTLLAHLPLLLHAAPHDVCIIGFGSGVTAGAALAHPVDRVDTIELTREVLRASEFFSTENRAALRDARHHVRVGDGRAHVRLARRAYDVIISAPANPWRASAAPLFTREYFTAARDRLAAGGLFAQPLPLRGVTRSDLRSLLTTLTSVFPHTSVWLIGDASLLVIGGPDPIEPRIADLTRRWQTPGVAADLERVQVRDPFSLLTSFVAQDAAVAALAREATAQTDDRLGLAFSAPRGLLDRGQHLGWVLDASARATRPPAIAQAEMTATAAQWRDRASMLLAADAGSLAFDAAEQALARDPADAETIAILSQAAAQQRREPEALVLLERAQARAAESAMPLLALSRLRESTGNVDGALEAATAVTRRFPERFDGWEQLASLLVERRDEAQLGRVVDAMQAQFADRWETRYFSAALHLLRNEVSHAVRAGELVLRERASDPRTLALLGAAYTRLGIRARARDAFEAGIQSAPRDPASYIQLARLELEAFNSRRAAALFSEALVLDPRSPAALNGLADALLRMGRADRARELRARAGS